MANDCSEGRFDDVEGQVDGSMDEDRAPVRLPMHSEDPVWINEHEYYVRWQGRLARVDIRKLRPIR